MKVVSNFVSKPTWPKWDVSRVLSFSRPRHKRGKLCRVSPNETLVVCLLPIHKGIESGFCF